MRGAFVQKCFNQNGTNWIASLSYNVRNLISHQAKNMSEIVEREFKKKNQACWKMAKKELKIT